MSHNESRNAARAEFAATGATYENLNDSDLTSLRDYLQKAMIESEAIDGSLRMTRHKPRWKVLAGKKQAELRCRSHYFESREAVTFNPNGFIGLAGWADDENAKPILSGFTSWISDLKARADLAGTPAALAGGKA